MAKLTVEAGTLGQNEVCLNDILNVKITMKLSNLKKGQESGYVHSRNYPFLKRDEWLLLITDQSMTGVAMVEKIALEGDEFVKEF